MAFSSYEMKETMVIEETQHQNISNVNIRGTVEQLTFEIQRVGDTEKGHVKS